MGGRHGDGADVAGLAQIVESGVATLGSIGSRRVAATVVSVLAAAAILCVAAWMLLGNAGGGPQDGSDVEIIPPADAATAGGSRFTDAPGATHRGETLTPADIAVYLTGEVVNPGVYTVPVGRRLANVVDLAGGPTENADLDRVNLAAYVSDAGHYRIPATGETGDGIVEAVSDAGVISESDGSGIPSTSACAVSP